jgi:hypothetical protein
MLRSDSLAFLRRDWRGVAVYTAVIALWMTALVALGALIA